MNQTKPSPETNAAVLEQFESSLRDLAVLMGSYYSELLRNGVPEPLAADLIRDWHYVYWNKIMPGAQKGPNEQS